MTALLVTGTGTGVGKTVVTAALAAVAASRGQHCIVVKPAQTGVPDDAPGDLAEVERLAGDAVGRVELVRYPDPLSPAAAARRSGRLPLDPARAADAVRRAQDSADLVLVEGAGGLLVHYDEAGFTMADLARTLGLPVLVVVEAGLGTLNATALTLEALAHRGVALAGLVIGSWPEDPDLAARCNVTDLEALAGQPLLGALPAGLGDRGRADFLAASLAGLCPSWGGTFDPDGFRGGLG